MAFQQSRFVLQTSGFNAGQVLTTVNPSATPVLENGPAFYSYASADDSVATISGANYFTTVAYQLRVNDVIMVIGSDASTFVQVDAVDTSVIPATITVVSFTASAAVNTANIVNNAVTSAKLALTTIQYTSVAITAAQFNGMYATPKLLVAAGGANTLLVLDKVQLLMTYGAANFAAGGVAHVQYDSTANGAGVIASTTLSAATFQAAASTGFNFNAGVVAETFTTCVNKGLYLSNVTGAFTTGDSTFVAHVWYKVIATV